DMGDYPSAFVHLGESVELAQRGADDRQRAFSLSLMARAPLLRGARSQATAAIGQSLELAQQQRWLAFLPWPQAIRGELELADGDLEAGAGPFGQAGGARAPR